MFRAIRTFISGLHASATFGRACRLREQGNKVEALAAAREALSILSQPHVIRSYSTVASSVVCSTVLVEQLSSQLNQPGASARDIAESVECLRKHGGNSEAAAWLPQLEQRLHQVGTSAV